MKYQKAFNIWSVPVDLMRHAQPGQWVYAGTEDNLGMFLGVKPSGTVVVAWRHNMRARKGYVKILRQYAKQ